MILYLDTSLVVTALTREPDTDAVRAWLASNEGEEFAASSWTVTEWSSALSIKERIGDISPAGRTAADSAFQQLSRQSIRILEVPRTAFVMAAGYCQQATAVRAADALHLAVAAANGAKICTRDVAQAAAAEELSIPFQLLTDRDG